MQPLTNFYGQVIENCKGEKGNIDRKPYSLPMDKEIHIETLSMRTQDYAQKPQRNCLLMNLASEEVFEIGSHPFPTRED
jgi:hypothetical protein